MNTPPPLDPRVLAGDLARTMAFELGPEADNKLLTGLLQGIDERAARMAATAPPPDPKALAKLAAEMGDDLDQLEDLLEALALTAGPGRAG